MKNISTYEKFIALYESSHGPLNIIAYHGTTQEFDVFDKRKMTDREGKSLNLGWGRGVFCFASSASEAHKYATEEHAGNGKPRVIKAEISMKNPYYIGFSTTLDLIAAEHAERYSRVRSGYRDTVKPDLYWSKYPDGKNRRSEGFVKQLKSEGYDGIVHGDKSSGYDYIVFDKNQIKILNSIDEKLVDRSDPNETDVWVWWSNGSLVLNPTNDDRMKDYFGMGLQIDRKRKIVRISPMDDWADVKIIKKLQAALKDLIEEKVITEDWTGIILDAKLTERSLGSKKVKDILNFDSSFKDKIPYAFHGTTKWHLDRILKEGIAPRNVTTIDPNWKKGYAKLSPKQIYLTIDYNRALYYANQAVEALKNKDIKTTPVVLEIKDLPTKSLVADDDFDNNVSILQLVQMVTNGTSDEQEKGYVKSIRSTGQFALKGKIDPTQITKVYNETR